MTLAVDNLASSYWSMQGAAAFPGLSFGGMSDHFEDLTTVDEPAGRGYRVRRFAKDIFGALHREDATRTVDIRPAAALSFKAVQEKLISSILQSEAGEEISEDARYQSVLFLTKMPKGCALPSVSFGHGEIVFEWDLNGGDKAATASFEGDGLVGYAMLRDGQYVPGQADENLFGTPFPADLAEYLSVPTTR